MLGEKPSAVLELNLARGCSFTAVATPLADRRSRSKFDGHLPSGISSPGLVLAVHVVLTCLVAIGPPKGVERLWLDARCEWAMSV